jgi:hypothetical protein
MFRGSSFEFGSGGEDPFERMMHQHNTFLNELLGGSGNPFGRPLFQDPTFGSMMNFHHSFSSPSSQSQLPSRRMAPTPDYRQTHQHQPRRTLSVTEIADDHDVTEEERTQLELAIAQSLAESHAQLRPTVTDLDAEEENRVQQLYHRHHEENRSPPSNDSLVLIDDEDDIEMTDVVPHVVEDEEDEQLRRVLELSKREEDNRRRSQEEIERSNLIQEQRTAYEESLRQDTEKQTKEKFKRNWLLLARNLPSEPLESDSNSTRLVIRLPTGQRVNRRFLKDDTLSIVRTFVDNELAKAITSPSSSASSEDFSSNPLFAYVPESSRVQDQTYGLATDFPNVVFKEDNKTLEEMGLHPRALISVRSRK